MAKRKVENLLVFTMGTGKVVKKFGRYRVGGKFEGTLSTAKALEVNGYLKDVKEVKED